MDVPLDLVWGKSPIGITVYLPRFDDEGLVDMELVWTNDAVSRRGNMAPAEMIGWSIGKIIGQDNWLSLRNRYAEMLESQEPMTYARTFNNPEIPAAGTFSYEVTAWPAGRYVAVQVREWSNDPLTYKDHEDIEAAMRLLDARSASTLQLAELLTNQKVKP